MSATWNHASVKQTTGTVAQRLRQISSRYGLDEPQQTALTSILDAIASDDRAPTTVRDPERAVDVHVADSLVALEVPGLRAAASIADVGAGAGFPGLPLAVALPLSRIVLVESQARKCLFLRTAVAVARVGNASVVKRRVEEWSEGLGVHDAVLARALAPPSVVLEYAAPLLLEGGLLIDWRGRRSPDEEIASATAAAELGMELAEIRSVHPFPAARDRHLHLYLKVRETPPRYPRRPGMARKRPLGQAACAKPTASGGSVP